MSAIDTLRELFPWINTLGLEEQIIEWVTQGFTGEEIVAALRQTEQYKQVFRGIRRPDGTLRMNEAQFLQRRDEYRQVMRQFGRPDYEYDDPADFEALFEQEIDPNEFRDRFETYDKVVRGAADVRDAFYVYAGIKLTDDDLYLLTVYPGERQRYVEEYNRRVAASPLDYQTWITRATEAGLDRVVQTLSDLERQGVVTSDAIDQVRQLNPSFARQIADALYHGQTPEGPFLSLSELMNSFEYALIGGAAAQSGLDLPTKARLDALRSAGIDRTRALEGYSTIARQGNALQGALDRMGANRRFTVEDFEKAIFLNRAEEQELLEKAVAYDKSLSAAGGGARAELTRRGQFAQSGLYRR